MVITNCFVLFDHWSISEDETCPKFHCNVTETWSKSLFTDFILNQSINPKIFQEFLIVYINENKTYNKNIEKARGWENKMVLINITHVEKIGMSLDFKTS